MATHRLLSSNRTHKPRPAPFSRTRLQTLALPLHLALQYTSPVFFLSFHDSTCTWDTCSTQQSAVVCSCSSPDSETRVGLLPCETALCPLPVSASPRACSTRLLRQTKYVHTSLHSAFSACSCGLRTSHPTFPALISLLVRTGYAAHLCPALPPSPHAAFLQFHDMRLRWRYPFSHSLQYSVPRHLSCCCGRHEHAPVRVLLPRGACFGSGSGFLTRASHVVTAVHMHRFLRCFVCQAVSMRPPTPLCAYSLARLPFTNRVTQHPTLLKGLVLAKLPQATNLTPPADHHPSRPSRLLLPSAFFHTSWLWMFLFGYPASFSVLTSVISFSRFW